MSAREGISDPARFAYTSLFCLLWKENYFDQSDEQFRDETIGQLLQHFQLVQVSYRLLRVVK